MFDSRALAKQDQGRILEQQKIPSKGEYRVSEKHCSQIEGIPRERGDIYKDSIYMCKLTGERCIASEYEDPDPGHPLTRHEASYDNALAERICPVYNIPKVLAEKIKKFRLNVEKAKLEGRIKEMDTALI